MALTPAGVRPEFACLVTGGIALLDHRLMALTPAGVRRLFVFSRGHRVLGDDLRNWLAAIHFDALAAGDFQP